MGFVSGPISAVPSARPQTAGSGPWATRVTPAGPFGSVSRPPSSASRLPGLGNTYFLQRCLSAQGCEGFGGGSCETYVTIITLSAGAAFSRPIFKFSAPVSSRASSCCCCQVFIPWLA